MQFLGFNYRITDIQCALGLSQIKKLPDFIKKRKEIANIYNKEFKSIEEECLQLTDYAVNVRYPYPMDLNEADMKLAIKDAEKIKEFILSKVESIKSKIRSKNSNDDQNQQ